MVSIRMQFQAGNLSWLRAVSLANGDILSFQSFQCWNCLQYMHTIFFCFSVGKTYFLCGSLNYWNILSHILLRFNEIGYYFVLPCLLMYWIVPYTTMLMLVVFIIPNLRLIITEVIFCTKSRRWKMKLCPDYLFSEDDRLFWRFSGNEWENRNNFIIFLRMTELAVTRLRS